MIPYYVLIIIPVAISFIGENKKDVILKKKCNRIAMDCFFVLFLLLLSLRNISVGIDLIAYKKIFVEASKTSLLQFFTQENDYEIGYLLLNKLISIFSKDFQVFIACIAVITVLPMWIIYREDCDFLFLKIILFVTLPTFLVVFSGLRQAIAYSSALIAYKWIKEKKFIKFLITVCFAWSMHQSALLLLIMYPLYYLKIKNSDIFYIVPILLVILIFNKNIFNFILPLLGERYSTYEKMTITNSYGTIILFVLFLLFAFLIPSEYKMDQETKGLRNFLIVAVIIQLFAPIHSIAMRFGYYFIIFIPILIPKVVKYSQDDSKSLASYANIIMCLFFLIYFFYHAYTSTELENLNIYPYSFFWSN